jgi:hypothetical protein
MKREKKDIEKIIKKTDELTEILKLISKDLKEISINLKKTLIKDKVKNQRTISVETNQKNSIRTIDDIQKIFPSNFVGMLYFEVMEDHILIRPRQFLGSETFTKIALIIREQLKGEYVSAGRNSHFKIPRKT